MKRLKKLLLPLTLVFVVACSDDDDPIEVTPPPITPDTIAPTIADVPDVELLLNTMGNVVELMISDNSDSAIMVTATSNNAELFPDDSLVVSDNVLVLTPQSDTIGSAVITITATDGSSNTSSVSVNVIVVDDPDVTSPTIAMVPALEIDANSAGNIIPLDISDDRSWHLTVTAQSDNSALFSADNLFAAKDILVVTPTQDTIGSGNITITATDESGNHSSIEIAISVIENQVSARDFIRSTFALPANSEPVAINGIALMQDIQHSDEFDDLLQSQ